MSEVEIFDIQLQAYGDHIEKLRELLQAQDDECLALDIERLVGLHMSNHPSAGAALNRFRSEASLLAHYGADIVEVWP